MITVAEAAYTAAPPAGRGGRTSIDPRERKNECDRMPTYQYRCPECKYEFEEFQSINDAPVQTCPRCGRKPRRIITGGAGFLLKGTGFYSTDYRSESYKAAARRDTDSPASVTTSKTDSSKGTSPGAKSSS